MLVAERDSDVARLVRQGIRDGADRILVVPTAWIVDGRAEPHDTPLAGVELDRIRRESPGVTIHTIGAASNDDGAVGRMIETLRSDQPADDAIVSESLARVFGDRTETLGTFLAVLDRALPEHTELFLRGSAVNGRSYETGRPFDGGGPGTSDLDLVVVGDEARAMWVDEALLLGGINSLPLCDDSTWVAPILDPARREAQEIVRRPVSIQSMAGWFLELRGVIQDQRFIRLAGRAG